MPRTRIGVQPEEYNVGVHAHASSLVFEVQGRLCALALEHVRETMRPLPLMPLPGTLPPVLGVSIVRGVPVPVVDAARLVGGVSSRPTRYISISLADRHAALCVDAVLGVRNFSDDLLSDCPPLLREANEGVVRGIGMLDERLLMVLDSMRVVPDEAWTAVAEWSPGQ